MSPSKHTNCWRVFYVAAESPAPATNAAAAASSDSFSSADSSRADLDDEEADRVQQAVEVVAEMQLTAEQLKVRGGYWGHEMVVEAGQQGKE